MSKSNRVQNSRARLRARQDAWAAIPDKDKRETLGMKDNRPGSQNYKKG